MKKMIMALVCATMSLTLMAQPKDKKDNDRQPRMEQACQQGQGCPMNGQMQGCPMNGQMQGCPMNGQMQQKAPGDISILKQIGVDTTKIKKVKEMREQNRKELQELKEKNRKAEQDKKAEYNKNLRKLLGEDTYIKYLEAKVAQNQGNVKKPMGRGMNQKRQGKAPKRQGMNPKEKKSKK